MAVTTTTDGGGGVTELPEDEENGSSNEESSFHARESGSLFLRMLLGSINVRAAQKDGRFKVKEEYNAYRVSTAFLRSLQAFKVETSVEI